MRNLSEEGESTSRIRAAVASYFFCVYPALLSNKPIHVKIHRRANAPVWATYTINGKSERFLPVIGDTEVQMLKLFVNYDFVESDIVVIRSTPYILANAVHKDTIAILKSLGISLAPNQITSKVMRDLRVAHLIINHDFDAGFLRLFGYGIRRSNFFKGNMFYGEIRDHLLERHISKNFRLSDY